MLVLVGGSSGVGNGGSQGAAGDRRSSARVRGRGGRGAGGQGGGVISGVGDGSGGADVAGPRTSAGKRQQTSAESDSMTAVTVPPAKRNRNGSRDGVVDAAGSGGAGRGGGGGAGGGGGGSSSAGNGGNRGSAGDRRNSARFRGGGGRGAGGQGGNAIRGVGDGSGGADVAGPLTSAGKRQHTSAESDPMTAITVPRAKRNKNGAGDGQQAGTR